MSLDMKVMVENSRPARSEDDVALWAAEVWALPPDALEMFAADFGDVLADEDHNPESRECASLFLQAVEQAQAGVVPSVELMRRVGLAIARVPRGEDR